MLDHFVMILHESPGSRFSLIPGDYLGKGSVKETIKLGEMKLLGISQQKKEFSIAIWAQPIQEIWIDFRLASWSRNSLDRREYDQASTHSPILRLLLV